MNPINHSLRILFAGLLMALFTNGCKNNPAHIEEPVRFGVVADVQYADKPEAMGRYYADSPDALGDCIADMKQNQTAFLIQLGDIIDGGDNAEAELKTIATVYNTLPMPGYHTLGNHDFVGIDRPSVLNILGMDKAYYSFDVDGWRFVVLDTQDLAVQGGWDEKSDCYKESVAMLEALKAAQAENAAAYNGGIGACQKEWLEGTLQQADEDNEKVIVCGHLPLMPAGEKHTLWNADEIRAIFEAHHCVKAYFCGHRHDGGYTLENGIHYVIFEAMVNAANEGGAWAVVTLSNDTIVIDGVGAATSRQLKIENAR